MATGMLEKCTLHGWIMVSTVPGRWQTACMESCGRAVCSCQCCEQSAPWRRWGYGIGRQQKQLHFIDCNLYVQRYRDEILRPVVVPFIRRHQLVFLHDNALLHVTRTCTQFLEAENVPVLPAYSPDMSPHWACLRCSGSTIFHRPQSTAWSTLWQMVVTPLPFLFFYFIFNYTPFSPQFRGIQLLVSSYYLVSLLQLPCVLRYTTQPSRTAS